MSQHKYKKSANSYLILFLIGLLLLGCKAAQTNQQPTNNIDSKIDIETNIQLPTKTILSIESTLIPLKPSETPSPSTTLTIAEPPQKPLETPTRMPQSTPVSTLTFEEETTFLQGLMIYKNECILPCWWGIELGDSLEEVANWYVQNGIDPWLVEHSYHGSQVGYSRLGYFDTENNFYIVGISPEYYAIDEKVQVMIITVERPLLQFGEEQFVRDWQGHFLDTILQVYGKPSFVYLIPTNIIEPGSSDYLLNLYYLDLGVHISYFLQGNSTDNNGVDEVCFSLETTRRIKLFLYNQNLVDVWTEEILLDAGYLNEVWTWEAQLGTDLDSFYETYRDSNNLGCIQVLR